MSVDHCPTCPDCGDDLVYDPHRTFSIETLVVGNGEWVCPECGRSFDFPSDPIQEPEPE